MKTFKQVREELKSLIQAVPALDGVPVFLEHEQGDMTAQIETTLATKGIVICVQMASGAVRDRAARTAVIIRVAVRVSLLVNPAVNTSLSIEDALHALFRGTLGKPCGDGELSLGSEVFARASGDYKLALGSGAFAQSVGDSGALETIIGFEAPVLIRATSQEGTPYDPENTIIPSLSKVIFTPDHFVNEPPRDAVTLVGKLTGYAQTPVKHDATGPIAFTEMFKFNVENSANLEEIFGNRFSGPVRGAAQLIITDPDDATGTAALQTNQFYGYAQIEDGIAIGEGLLLTVTLTITAMTPVRVFYNHTTK